MPEIRLRKNPSFLSAGLATDGNVMNDVIYLQTVWLTIRVGALGAQRKRLPLDQPAGSIRGEVSPLG